MWADIAQCVEFTIYIKNADGFIIRIDDFTFARWQFGCAANGIFVCFCGHGAKSTFGGYAEWRINKCDVILSEVRNERSRRIPLITTKYVEIWGDSSVAVALSE